MIKIENMQKEIQIIPMCEMKPLQGGYFDDGDKRVYVMRTASIAEFEVIDLSIPGPDRCWIEPNPGLEITLLQKGQTINLVVGNFDDEEEQYSDD